MIKSLKKRSNGVSLDNRGFSDDEGGGGPDQVVWTVVM